MSKKDQFFGIIISAVILGREDLSATEKIIYSYVASFRRGCWKSNDDFARTLGISKRTLQRALRSLAEKELLAIDERHGRKIYDVFQKPNKKRTIEVRKDCGKPVEKVRHFGAGGDNLSRGGVNLSPQTNRGSRAILSPKEYKNKIKNKNEPPALAGNRPAGGSFSPERCSGSEGLGRPARSDFENTKDWIKALGCWKRKKAEK